MSCSTDICISNTGIYDDTYTIDGQYYSLDYYTGATNGYYVFYSITENRWCLAANLGDPCLLFGPTPTSSICPDFYPSILSNGPCPPTPPTTPPCDIDFNAEFDCDVPPTPTPTPTSTITPTPTMTPTPTNVCGGVSLDVTANTYSPTPTPTPTNTPTPSSPIDRPCNYDGVAKFNNVDGFIVCATSKKFEDCFTGIEYYTTQTLFDSIGNLLVIGDVYGGTINGKSSCFIFQTIVDNISGGDKVVITTEYGPSSDGSCLNCIPITSTPTMTPTMTPTPTKPCLCNAYTISNFDGGAQLAVIMFNDCSDNRLVDLRPGSMGWLSWGDRVVRICSTTVPTISIGTAIITNVGVCCNNTLCVQYLLNNNSPVNGQTYVYTDLSGLSSTQTLNAYQSIIINSLSTPYSLFGAIEVSETGVPCFPSPSPTPTMTQTPTKTSTPTVTPTKTKTPTPTKTVTPTVNVTPTVTKTSTPTPTMTQTPTSSSQPTSYQWTSGSNWWGTDVLACSNYFSYASNGWTTSTSIPTVGNSLIDNGTNLPVSGQNNQWIAISSVSAPGVIIYAVEVNSFGIISNVILCP
jgi:hypothetical protein